jgi:arylsulfatase
VLAGVVTLAALPPPALAQQAKPNILFIVSDDTGYGDLGPYGGGEGRGMPTPNIDRLATEGATFFSSTPSRAARRGVRRCRPAAFPIGAG